MVRLFMSQVTSSKYHPSPRICFVLMLLAMFSWSCLAAVGSARSMVCFPLGYSQYSSLLWYSVLK